MDMDKVARIHKKELRLDRVYTKAKPQTRSWSEILHMITDPLGLRMVRI